MANGKPGDHPFTDIMIHGRDAYSPRVANLVQEIAKLSSDEGRRALADLLFIVYNEFNNPDVQKLERILTEMRHRLLREAREGRFRS